MAFRGCCIVIPFLYFLTLQRGTGCLSPWQEAGRGRERHPTTHRPRPPPPPPPTHTCHTPHGLVMTSRGGQVPIPVAHLPAGGDVPGGRVPHRGAHGAQLRQGPPVGRRRDHRVQAPRPRRTLCDQVGGKSIVIDPLLSVVCEGAPIVSPMFGLVSANRCLLPLCPYVVGCQVWGLLHKAHHDAVHALRHEPLVPSGGGRRHRQVLLPLPLRGQRRCAWPMSVQKAWVIFCYRCRCCGRPSKRSGTGGDDVP